ncbi:hypothetical protein G9A89_009831 [Geosiphon pyriformis]|nr:hypothetical protein G9A89_009831 [Geosiphon pyriformis]
MLRKKFDKTTRTSTNNNHSNTFNCYVNKRIVYHLGGQGNPESAFNNFFSELFQSTTLPQNYLFTPLITKINQEIEKYTKQRFPITFADKKKGKLQTPVRTPKQIQLPTWKKQRFDLSVNLSYHHTPGSTINIINTAKISVTMPLNQIPFQSKQKKEELLGTYTNTFTTIKQGETEAVTIYLGHFHRNLPQIQAIQADYFTAPQILNQFICRLCSSLLQ